MPSATAHSGLSFDEASNEAKRILEHADSKGVLLRLVGALAICLRSLETRKHCHLFLEGRISDQEKPFTDIDLVGYGTQEKKIRNVLEQLGYRSKGGFADIEFGRLVYEDQRKGLVVDVFLDTLNMCHTIDFRGRLESHKLTASPADLLLTKTQIVNITEKDVKDSLCLLLDHEISVDDQAGLNCKHIAETLAKDWGFYYTVTTNLKKLKTEFSSIYSGKISPAETQDLHGKIDKIISAIEHEQKTMGWKVRARIGPKKKWYEEVEAY